jgi:hypothetical protein
MLEYLDKYPFEKPIQSQEDLIKYIYSNPLDLVTGTLVPGKLSIPINKDNRKKILCKRMWHVFENYIQQNFPLSI